jgi:hypothetical protein
MTDNDKDKLKNEELPRNKLRLGSEIHDYRCLKAVRFATNNPLIEDRCTCAEIPKFVALGKRVHYGRDLVCRTETRNMATRIANALNEHVTDRRGQ